MSTTKPTSLLDRLCAEMCDADVEFETNLKRAQALRQSTLSKAFGSEGFDD